MLEEKLSIRVMTMEDYEELHKLWMEISGFGIRTIDDSKEGVGRFIRRNPTTSMVAIYDGKLKAVFSADTMGEELVYITCV